MNLIYFKSDIGNFGDDLNTWLWEKLLGDFSSYDASVDFVGIGSILDARIMDGRRKIIFGSGVRDCNIDQKDVEAFDIRFVRGPISSKILGGVPFIADSAYCLRLLSKKEFKKIYKLSFIPYFRHVPYFNWNLFERVTGIHIILPTNEVEKVITEINQSEKILTAAMHGAILADLYRVPWMRVRFSKHGYETNFTSELKWNDWFRSIEFDDIPVHDFNFTFSGKRSGTMTLIMTVLMWYKFRHNSFLLSSEAVLKKIDSKLDFEIQFIKNKYR